ncbi:MAG TPA: hypothetical protein VKV26_00820 [Dehalococcoidia bacterium]|nr:hypothetical protein [Dehalococcoidia bacterium]
MPDSNTEVLLIRGDDGTLYAIPRGLLERCRVDEPAGAEVQGYLNPQPIPPGREGQFYQVLGYSPVRVQSSLDFGAPFGIIVGGIPR